MLKLSSETKDIIVFAVKYCYLVGIDSLVIDKQGIRAKQDETAVYLIEPGDFDFLEFDSLYINRVKSIFPRFKMFETSKIDYDVYANIKQLNDDSLVVSQLRIQGSNTKVNFNAAMLSKNVQLPRKMNDPNYYKFSVASDDLPILKKGISAMGAEVLKIYSKGGEVYCQIKDIEQDVLTQKLTTSYKTLHDDADDDFDFAYTFKIIWPLLNEAGRDSENFKITITRKGIMLLKINGLSMYIFAEID